MGDAAESPVSERRAAFSFGVPNFRLADNPGVGPSNDRKGEKYDRSDDCAVFHAGRNLRLEGQRASSG